LVTDVMSPDTSAAVAALTPTPSMARAMPMMSVTARALMVTRVVLVVVVGVVLVVCQV